MSVDAAHDPVYLVASPEVSTASQKVELVQLNASIVLVESMSLEVAQVPV
jgi:hypothetical protein